MSLTSPSTFQLKEFSIQLHSTGRINILPQSGKFQRTIIFFPGITQTALEFIELFLTPPIVNSITDAKVVIFQPGQLLWSPTQRHEYAYFNINVEQFSLDQGGRVIDIVDKKLLDESFRYFKPLIDEEIKILNGKMKNIIIGGFSQGASFSSYIFDQYDYQFAKFYCLQGYSLFNEEKFKKHDQKSFPPLFLLYGGKDKVLPVEIFGKEWQLMLTQEKLEKSFVFLKDLQHQTKNPQLRELLGEFLQINNPQL